MKHVSNDCSLRVALCQWAQDRLVIDTMSAAQPEMPKDLGNRMADIPEPPVSIADRLGGGRSEFTRPGCCGS